MAHKLTIPDDLAAKKEVTAGSKAAAEENHVKIVPANVQDSDGDEMPDEWERRFGLNPFDPTDALGDPDGDGVPNLDEFRQGTNPLKRNVKRPDLEKVTGEITEKRFDIPMENKPVHPEHRGRKPADDETL